jgi:AraC-like DNA-binding protein
LTGLTRTTIVISIMGRRRVAALVLLSFSTDGFAPRDRAEAARAAYSTFARIGIEPRGTEPFRSKMTALGLSGLAIGHINNSPCAVARTPSHIAGGNDDWVLYIVTKGRCSARLRGRKEATYEAGDAYLAPNDLAGTFLLDRIEHVQIAVPRAAIAARLNDRATILERRFNLSRSPELRYLAGHARMLLGEEPSSASASLIASHVHDLMVLMLGARHDEAEAARLGGLRAARLRAVLAEIEERCTEPGLSAQQVGLRVGMAERTVQDMLHETGATFSERVLALRLERARAMLVQPGETRHIRQIAYACGFTSVAYFNRAFRRRFGATPSETRWG